MNAKSTSGVHRRAHIKYSKKPVYRKKASVRGANESLMEMVIMQCIVCGIVLCVVMLICIIKTPGAWALRENMQQALANDVGLNQFGVVGIADDISLSFKNIFGLNKETQTKADEVSAEEVVPAFFTQEKEFRIDEDIINSIYSGGLSEYGGEIKNMEAPQD